MTIDDYMKLPKRRLAELLAQRDIIPQVPFIPPHQFPVGTPLCPFGGACTNKFGDCVNCPGVIGGGDYQVTTASTLAPEIKK